MVSLDVNYRSKLWSREEARAVLTPLARHASILIASDDELGLVATAPDAAVDDDAGEAGGPGDSGAEVAMAAQLLGHMSACHLDHVPGGQVVPIAA